MKYLFMLILVSACGGSAPVAAPQSCTVKQTPNGAYLSCPDGTNAAVDNGSDGAAGQNGTNGSNGTNGVDGTQVTPVQFCKGFTLVYPSSFPESGVCISGQMYGVYSANDGFLALLPPGTYSSNGINASCTFTLLANCVVQ